VLQGALKAEITEHLGYEPHAVDGSGTGNLRNGHSSKTVRTKVGDVRLDVPRDRNSGSKPVGMPPF
jgi:putative transposase